KIESLLQIPSNSSMDASSDLATVPFSPSNSHTILMTASEETSKLIQRVANEFNQLKFYCNKLDQFEKSSKNNFQKFNFFNHHKTRIKFIESSISKGIENLFIEGLKTKNEDIISNCLRT